MNEEESREVSGLDEKETPVKRVRCGRIAVLSLAVALCLAVSASATNGGSGTSDTGLTAVLGSMDTVISICTSVWGFLTSNAYFTLFLAIGLVFAGLRVFRRAKKTASR